MNIFITGGGRVGFHLARLLSAEGHSVTVLESNATTVEHVDVALDARTILGRAEDVLMLKQLDAGAADLFIAATGNDEINLIAATTAKGLGAKQVVARVRNPMYHESDILYETIMGIDYILSPQALAAHEVVNYVEHPGMVAMESFGRGLIQMQQIQVTNVPLQEGQSLKDLKLPKGLLVGLIGRNGDTEIPDGSSVIRKGEVVTLVGRKESVEEAKSLFHGVEIEYRRIFLMGGSRTSLHIARMLEKQGREVKIFEWNMARCEELAAELTRTKVVCRDATSRLDLEQEHVDRADLFIAATHDDERNIMGSVLAKEAGARRVLTIVHQPDFAPLLPRLGIDHAVTPRACLANRVLRLVNKSAAGSVAVIGDGRIEILEFRVEDHAAVINRRLADVKFPKEALIASILRGEEVIVPTGNDVLLPGDVVVMIVGAQSLESAKRLFQE